MNSSINQLDVEQGARLRQSACEREREREEIKDRKKDRMRESNN